VVVECGNQRFDGRIGLAVDVDTEIWPRGDQFGERGDVLVAVDHDRFDLGRIEVVDLRVNSTGSQEVIVVEGEEHSVTRRMDVGLDVAISE
jgi:hypothetical protein